MSRGARASVDRRGIVVMGSLKIFSHFEKGGLLVRIDAASVVALGQQGEQNLHLGGDLAARNRCRRGSVDRNIARRFSSTCET